MKHFAIFHEIQDLLFGCISMRLFRSEAMEIVRR